MPERQTDAASAHLIKRNGERNRRRPNKKLRIPEAQKKKAENREENQRDERKIKFLFNIKANVSPEPL